MQIQFLRRVGFIAFIGAILIPASVSADRLVMKNGDVITGTISKIEDNEVFIEPAYADEFAVDMAEVATLEADQTFEIELDDGSEIDASFAIAEDGQQTLVIGGETQRVELAAVTLATEPEDWYDRTSHIDVNLTYNDGNTDSRNNLIFADTALKLGDHRHLGELTFRRDKTDDAYTKKQDLFNYSYNWLFSDPWYMGATFSYERDPIKELEHRYTAGLIMGRDIINDANRFLSISLGAGYTDEKFVTLKDSGATGLWDLRYTHDFLDGDMAFFHNHNINYQFYGVNNTIFKSNTGFRFDIIDDVYANISLRYDYETDPAEGAENDDSTLVVGIGAKF